MEKRNKENFILCLPLEVNKSQSDILNKRFEVCRLIYNNFQRKMLNKFKFVENLKAYKELTSKKDKVNFLVNYYGVTTKSGKHRGLFSELGVNDYIPKFISTYNKIGINSAILYNIASNAWSAWEKVLYGNGKRISFKKYNEFNSYSIGVSSKGEFHQMDINKLNENVIGININGRRQSKAKYIYLKYNVKTEYEKECLTNEIRQIGIKRVFIRGKWKYFITFCFEGKKPTKHRKLGSGKVGIDLGTSSIAICSDDVVYMNELAKDVEMQEKKKRILLRKIDRSRRKTNPQQFNEDGTIRKFPKGERPKWIISNHCKKYYNELKEIYRKQSVKRKESHIKLSNDLLHLGNEFIVEKNPISDWAKKTKETTINKKTGKVNKKKRFGKSIANHAPSMFITILENKVKSLGGSVVKVAIKNAASRFDFTNETFTEHELKERRLLLSNGNIHCRDSIAAFNLKHLIYYKNELKQYDVALMKENYKKFCKMEMEAIEILKHSKYDVRRNFGIKKF